MLGMTAARLRLSGLTVVLLAAGLLPWIVDGPGVARIFGVPFLLLGLFGAYGVARLGRVLPVGEAPTAFEPCANCNCANHGGNRDCARTDVV